MAKAKITKEEIIKKTLKAFSTQGYHYTSMADLAKICDIRNANFYYYFKNKEDLMREVLQYVQQSMEKKLDILLQQNDLLPKEKLLQIVAYIEKLYLQNPGGCIMGNTVLETSFLDLSFKDVLMDFFKKWINSLAIIYTEKFSAQQSQELAEATVQDIEGGIMLMRLYKDDKYLKNALKRALNQL
jgi:TetR/AcrR family transcriptional regulator, transcriptional repressor for nem operon